MNKLPYFLYSFLALALILECSAVQAQDLSATSYRDQLNAFHWQNDDFYRALDSMTPGPQASKAGADPVLYEFGCQDLWLSGTNLAWNNFGRDVGDGAVDISYMNNMFAEVAAAGGNSVRWWLHTNVSFTPILEANGNCTGLGDGVISSIQQVLDAAQNNNIALDICLFSFDMLQDQWEMDAATNKNFLTSANNIQSYIDNALTPMVNAFKDHPALLCWEVFNEPEGMSSEFGWTPTTVGMSDIQRVINMIAGAIHDLDGGTPVTNGSWSFRAMSDNVTGNLEQNYYRDDRLIAAGGVANGTLDFYQVHYYNWAGTALSPFHHDADYWGLDKPIMVAEFHVEETFGVAGVDLMDELYHRGYFGGWGWQYNEIDLWNEIQPALSSLFTDHSAVLELDYSAPCGPVTDNISIRATGVTGTEVIALEIDGVVVDTWTLGTTMATFTTSASATGVFRIVYENDEGDSDVQVDYLSVDGVTYEAEDQAINTGQYANGECGGGGNSELMHCNGYIQFHIGVDCPDSDLDGVSDCEDGCPNDIAKTAAGVCGCGVAEDGCATDPNGPLAQCHDKFLGNILPSNWQNPDIIPEGWATYWNQITPENAGKWGVVEGTRDQYNWADLDVMYEYAQANGLPFKQHVFVWGSQQPAWLEGLAAQEQLEELEEWYSLFAARYPNTDMVDVANESIRNHAPDIFFIDAIGGLNNGASNAYLAANVNQYGPYGTGWDYIIWSFAKARQYLPNAQLHLNDYGIINDPSAIAEHLEIVEILKQRGLIDAVGIQCHQFNVDNLSATNIQNNLDLLAQAGLPIYVAELDITGDTEQQQRDRYAEKFPIFWEHEAVAGVTIWGYIEGETWIDGTGLLNADGSERLAMEWLKSYMACPEDTVIVVDPCVDLTVSADTVCVSELSTITVADGVGPFAVYATNSDDNALDEGQQLTVELSETTTLYVADLGGQAVTSTVGETDLDQNATIWNIDDFETDDKKMAISVEQELTLDAISVYPQQQGGTVVLRVLNTNGSVIDSAVVVNASTGKVEVVIGTTLTPGDYILDAVGTTVPLQYQSDGGTFPYELAGTISFTGNASWVITDGRYGSFFDWSVTTGTDSDCPRTAVEVVVSQANDCGVITGASNPKESVIGLYPNPTTGRVKVYGSKGDQLLVFNSLGQVVISTPISSALMTIDLQGLPQGVYGFRIGSKHHKVIFCK